MVILGQDRTGKTLFSERMEFYEDYKKYNKISKYVRATLGFEKIILSIKFNDKLYKFIIFDTSGLDRFEKRNDYYSDMDIVLIFYDALDKDSFERAKSLVMKYLYDNKKQICFLIRSKYDLSFNSENNEIISDEEALEFADKNNLIFTHISPLEKYGNGLDDLFDIIFKEYHLRK